MADWRCTRARSAPTRNETANKSPARHTDARAFPFGSLAFGFRILVCAGYPGQKRQDRHAAQKPRPVWRRRFGLGKARPADPIVADLEASTVSAHDHGLSPSGDGSGVLERDAEIGFVSHQTRIPPIVAPAAATRISEPTPRGAGLAGLVSAMRSKLPHQRPRGQALARLNRRRPAGSVESDRCPASIRCAVSSCGPV